MAERDVLICGNCSSQFSDLKVFIDHKQTCGNAIGLTSVFNNAEISTIISAPQQASHIGSQQIPVVIPSTGHASIVSLPVGMPHVILQTSSGLSQMYRIVLEPSLNTSTQISPTGQVSQANQIPVYNSLHQSNSAVGETQFAIGTEDKSIPKETSYIANKMEINEKDPPVETSNVSLSEPSMARLSSMTPIDSSWTPRAEQRATLFEPVDSSVISEKTILDPISTTSNLHTEEEDVATFLATQLVSQSTPQQHTKCRDSNSIPKYCNVVHEPSPHIQDLTFVDVGPKAEEFSMQEKVNLNSSQDEKYSNKQVHPKNPPEGSQFREGTEVVEKGTKKIFCSYENCKFFTQHKKDMIRHIRKHTGEKPFECPKCSVKFSRQDKLKVHLRTHSKERPYPCNEPGCSYRGNEKAHLRKHLRTHTDERPYRCQFCPYGAKDGSHLTVHLRSHTGDTPFHCQVDGCSAMFKTSSDLKRHEKLHTGEKPFKCSECDYASALKSNLKVHFRINHFKGEKYGCKFCNFLATSRKQFKEHEKAHMSSSYPCGLVGHAGRNAKRMDPNSPIISTYPPHGKQASSVVESSVKKLNFSKGRRGSKPSCLKNFKCDKCGSGFVREDSYRSHIRQHERKRMEVERVAYPQQEQGDQGVQSPKGKLKPVYTLNFVLQGDNANLSREISCSGKEIVLAEKETKQNETSITNRTSIDISQNQGEEVPSSVGAVSDAFSPYMITIDGISPVYSNPGTQPKDPPPPPPPPAGPHSLSQEDPVVHVISSSPVNHPHKSSNPLMTNSAKALSNHERPDETMEQNLT